MDLFNQSYNPKKNYLPYDGEVNYHGIILEKSAADTFYDVLLRDIEWKNDKAIIYGKEIITKRKVAWYGDKDFSYTYSNTTKYALPWTESLLELKQIIQEKSGETYNSCLLNLYHDGSEGMAWHSDSEKDLKKNGAIGSMSLGAERKFSFKHNESKVKVDIHLEHGSLLIMKGTTQMHWKHRLPPTKKVTRPRINLTFRTIEEA